MAYMRDPMGTFPEYRTIETAAAFLQDFWAPVEDNFDPEPEWHTTSDEEDDGSDGDSDI